MADTFASWLLLRRTRELLRNFHGRLIGLGIAVLYLLAALYLSFDLFFTPSVGGMSSIIVYYWTGQKIWWDFPYLLILTPDVTVLVSLFQGVVFGITSFTVGLATAAAIVVPLLYWRRRPANLTPPICWSLSLLGMSCVVTSLAMEWAAYQIAISSWVGWVAWSYAWYLYVLEVVANVAFLFYFEHLLRVTNVPAGPRIGARADAPAGV